jgi:hypothetical protein
MMLQNVAPQFPFIAAQKAQCSPTLTGSRTTSAFPTAILSNPLKIEETKIKETTGDSPWPE